ncbi:MAG: GGDEF domain-containing protein [Patescibacteria group bacterium]|nr:GGDEF domain-containing protein [Patescibacteria group bacterium]
MGNKLKKTLSLLAGAIFFALLFLLSQYDYLFFHTLVESAIIVIGLLIFTIAFNAKKIVRNDFFLFLGVAFLSSSVLEFFHTLTYKGLSVIPGVATNVPTQLWLAGRYVLAASFLASPLFIGKELKPKNKVLLYSVFFFATAGLLLSILTGIFPDAYIEGGGLTLFKVVSEYVISLIFVAAIVLFSRKKQFFDNAIFNDIILSLAFSALAEISFTRYVSVYGFFNTLGHLFLILAGYFTYKGLISKALTDPYSLLFRELKDANLKLTTLASTDGLTGLYNRRFTLEEIGSQFERSILAGRPFSIAMLDLDNLKEINDKFGHSAGDAVLNYVGKILQKSFRSTDIVGRYGGDEFIVCLLDTTAETAQNILNAVAATIKNEPISIGQLSLPISISSGVCGFSGQKSLSELINAADKNLLENKKKSKVLSAPMTNI